MHMAVPEDPLRKMILHTGVFFNFGLCRKKQYESSLLPFLFSFYVIPGDFICNCSPVMDFHQRKGRDKIIYQHGGRGIPEIIQGCY